MAYLLIDSPLTPYSSPDDVKEWLDYLDTLPDTEQRAEAIKEAKDIEKSVLSRAKKK